tara:strand:+ start:19458 stop:20111 length:654 start_codon:yes stop_codon:yes gene_type:complete
MKKQLLNEQEIRKFMKFAEIGSLADGVIDRLDEGGMMYKDDEEDHMREGGMMYKDDDPEGALGAAGEGEGEEMGGDMPLPPEGAEDAGLGDEPAGTPEEKLKSILQAMADEAAKQGIDVEVAGGEEGMGDEAPPMDEPADDPAALDAGGEEPPMGDEAPMGDGAGLEAGGEEDAEDELEEDVFLEDDSDLVNEVARRVASRLMSAKRSNSRRPRRRK